MPSIILKKTFKIKPSGFKVSNEKSFSLHGRSVDANLIYAINIELAKLPLWEGANRLKFRLNEEYAGTLYQAQMNHNYQKYHEEDAVCIILDVMEECGWSFRFQYDTELSSHKGTGDSITKRELFIFHKSLHYVSPNTTDPTVSLVEFDTPTQKPRKTRMSSKSEKFTSSTTRRSKTKDEDSSPPPLTKMGAKSEKLSSTRK